MYLGIDGTGVLMVRSETEGVKGKQPDGTSKTRKMRVATAWTCGRLDEKGEARISMLLRSPTPRPSKVQVPGTQLACFARRMKREAMRRGFYNASHQVAIRDGTRWIWSCYSELFPKAIGILDLHNALEKIRDLPKVVYGNDTEIGMQWARNTSKTVKAGEIETLIDILTPITFLHLVSNVKI